MKTNTITINVDPTEVVSHPSRYLTGACIEDVNHELYGGIYSQMVFGESFAEPRRQPMISGFSVYGGVWQVNEGVLSSDGGSGPKLVLNEPVPQNSTIEVDIRISKEPAGYGGILFNVTEPGVGADNFIGYELSIDPSGQKVVFGRHRKNWEPICEFKAPVDNDGWNQLRIETGRILKFALNGQAVGQYEDTNHPLSGGTIALRPWQSAAQYRNLEVNGKQMPFEYEPHEINHDISGMWDPAQTPGTKAVYSIVNDESRKLAQAQKIEYVSGEGEVGIANRGLNRRGMGFVAGKPYEGIVWAQCDKGTELWIALESADGKARYAETSLTATKTGWNKLRYKATPSSGDKDGRLSVSLRKPGSATLGYVSLEPGPWGRFKGLPVRKDVAEGLISQGLTVLRMGGCMVNCPEYRWKNMVGPRDERQPYRGFWYPQSSNGWGVVEFMRFCRAAGFLCIPDFCIDESPQDMADFVDYANGSTSTLWGKKRADDGQKEPFHLKYIQLGNEEQLNDAYWTKFKSQATAIWEKDPSITLVVGDFAYNKVIEDPYNFEGGAGAKSLAIQKKIVEFAHAKGGKVAFDLHIWNDDPNQPDDEGAGLSGAKSFISQLKKLCPGMPFKVFIFEENANNHEVRRALGHAHAINEITRIADGVPILCAANCLQPDKQNDNGWDQGLLFLSANSVWGQPPYYVTQMVSRNYLPLCVKATYDGPQEALDVTATRSDDGKILQIAVVNIQDKPQDAIIDFPKYAQSTGKYRVEWIEGGLHDKNTEDNPFNVVSKKTTKKLKLKEGMLGHTFPAHSFTIIRLGV